MDKQLNRIPPVLVRLALILVLFLFLRGIYASGSARDVDMADIRSAMLQNTDMGKMKECNDRKLMQFMGINYENYDSYLYYKSKESLGVDEVLVVKVRSAADLDGLKDAAENRVQSQEKAFDGYGTNQMKLLANAVIATKGNYLFYCVAENPGNTRRCSDMLFSSILFLNCISFRRLWRFTTWCREKISKPGTWCCWRPACCSTAGANRCTSY